MEAITDWVLLVLGSLLVVGGLVFFGFRSRIAVWQQARSGRPVVSGLSGSGRATAVTLIIVAIMFIAVGAGMTVTSALRLWH